MHLQEINLERHVLKPLNTWAANFQKVQVGISTSGQTLSLCIFQLCKSWTSLAHTFNQQLKARLQAGQQLSQYLLSGSLLHHQHVRERMCSTPGAWQNV